MDIYDISYIYIYICVCVCVCELLWDSYIYALIKVEISPHAKAWTAIDWLSVIWKPDLSDKKKCNFSPSSCRIHTTVCMHHLDADEAYRKKAKRQLHKDAMS